MEQMMEAKENDGSGDAAQRLREQPSVKKPYEPQIDEGLTLVNENKAEIVSCRILLIHFTECGGKVEAA